MSLGAWKVIRVPSGLSAFRATPVIDAIPRSYKNWRWAFLWIHSSEKSADYAHAYPREEKLWDQCEWDPFPKEEGNLIRHPAQPAFVFRSNGRDSKSHAGHRR